MRALLVRRIFVVCLVLAGLTFPVFAQEQQAPQGGQAPPAPFVPESLHGQPVIAVSRMQTRAENSIFREPVSVSIRTCTWS